MTEYTRNNKLPGWQYSRMIEDSEAQEPKAELELMFAQGAFWLGTRPPEGSRMIARSLTIHPSPHAKAFIRGEITAEQCAWIGLENEIKRQGSPLPGGLMDQQHAAEAQRMARTQEAKIAQDRAMDALAKERHDIRFPPSVDPLQALARMQSEKVLGSRKRRLGERLADWRVRVGLTVRRELRGLSPEQQLVVAFCGLLVVACVVAVWRAVN